MTENIADKAFMIQAYYDDLEKRIAFLKELNAGGHKDEALMLCCCYIEALGSRQYHDSDRKAKNYSRVLEEHSGNNLFAFIHPKQLKKVLMNQKFFKANFSKIELIIDDFGNELILQKVVVEKLSSVINKDQLDWLNCNLFKGTIAAISYERVRSELVHDISTSNLTFSQTILNGKPVPDINFNLLYTALLNIFRRQKEISLRTNTFFGSNST